LNKYKICCITYKKLASLAAKAVENLADDEVEVTCLNCSHDKLKELVEAANRDGVEVFVAGGANLTVFKDTFGYPVVAIEPDFVDYLHSVVKAAEISNEIAVVSYKKVPSQDLTILESLLNVKISFITFDDIQMLEQQLAECPCKVVIGASLANDIAARLGKEGVLIYPGEDAVTNAIYKAKVLAEELRKNGERTQFLRALID
jgi:propionate catabolism operon transcriptional regulator